jgi:biopolymer transport protein ExbD
MQKVPQKPKKTQKNVQIPPQMSKKATNKEMLRLIVDTQCKQTAEISDIKVKVGTLEERLKNFVDNSKSESAKGESQRVERKADKRWIYGTIVGIIGTALAVGKFLWDVIPK